MSTVNIGKADVIWSYIGTFFRVSTNVILLPVLIYYLSAEELGLWYVYASITQLVVLFDFGFAPTFARNISYTWSGAANLKSESLVVSDTDITDFKEFKTILMSCKLVYIVISLIAFILLATIGSIYILHITSSDKYIISWLIYSFAVFLNILYGYYTSFLRGVGAVAENNQAAIVCKILQLSLTWLFLLLGYGLEGVSLAYLLSGLSLRLVSKYYFFRYEGIGTSLQSVIVKNIYKRAINKIKIIWHNASKDGLVTLSSFLLTQANTLTCSYVIGLSQTGSYGLSMQIATLISSIAGIPYSTFQTKMQSNAILGDKNSNLDIFSRAMFLYVFCFILLSILSFICFPILYIVKPDFFIDKTLYAFILIQTIIYGYYSLCASFISSYNILPYTKVFVITSVISVTLSFVLASFTTIGIYALVLSPIFVSCYNIWKWPNYVLSKILKVNLLEFIRNGYINSKGYIFKIKL